MMRGQRLELEVGALEGDASLLAHVGNQAVEQVAIAQPHARHESGGIVWQRHAMAAQLLRQTLQQQMHLLLEHARHQPFSALRGHLVERIQRHGERHAIAGAAGLEVIRQAHVDAGNRQHLREQVGRDAGRLMPHEVIAIQVQQLLAAFAARAGGLGIPALKRHGVVNVRWDLAVVERVDQFVVHQHVLSA